MDASKVTVRKKCAIALCEIVYLLVQRARVYSTKGLFIIMTFHCSNGIRQGGQLFPLLYNVYTYDLNHHLQATGVGCYVGGAWVNSLSYADDVVLFAPMVTALQMLLVVCRSYAGSHDIVYNTTKTVCILFRPMLSQGRY